MKSILKVFFVLMLCVSFVFAFAACDSANNSSEDSNNRSDNLTPPENGNDNIQEDEDIFVDYSSCEVVDKEVFAYDSTGARIVCDRIFVEVNNNVYYAINNIVVTGNFVVEGKAYSFDEAGVKQDVVLDSVFVTCEGSTYYIVNNVTVYNQIIINGAVYDFGEDGKMVVGEKDGYTYGEDGKLVANNVFITINNATYYIINNVTVYNQIIINGAVYDFGEDGKMVVGEKDGYTYGEDGKLVANNVFITINNATYYIINNVTVYNQIIINGAVYDFGEDGKMVVGEKDGYTYGEDGKLVANNVFITINNATYYIINNVTVYNQIIINGAVYDFGEDGKMVVGEKDGYTYGEDGKLVANNVFITINNATYYIINNVTVYNQIIINGSVYDFGEDGKMVVGDGSGDGDYGEDGKLIADNEFVTVGDKTYYFIDNVAVCSEYRVIDSRVYYFTDDGSRLENTELDGYTFGADGYIVSEYAVITVDLVNYVIINDLAYESVGFNGTVVESDGDRDPENNPKLSGVVLNFTVAGKTFTATTNSDGEFDLGDMPKLPGELVLSLDGYISVNVTVSASEDKLLVMDRRVSNSLSGQILVADADNNVSNNAPLSGASITLVRISSTNALNYEAVTDYNGNYYFTDLTAGMYKLVVSKEGYVTIEQTVQVRYNESNVYNVALEAIPTPDEDDFGYASGTVTDARTGYSVSGLTVYIFKGINNIDGEWLQKLTTDSYGSYTTEALVPGNYTAYVVDERELSDENLRYGSVTIPLKVIADTTVYGQNTTVSNSIGLTVDGIRIVLTWGSSPGDLDSHLQFGSNHVYYGNKIVENCQLDVDDTSAYGPETITISSIGSYTYNYYVYNFSNYGTMAASQATVTIYFGSSSTPAYTLRPPTGSGYTWNVFTYNAATGEFTITNTLR